MLLIRILKLDGFYLFVQIDEKLGARNEKFCTQVNKNNNESTKELDLSEGIRTIRSVDNSVRIIRYGHFGTDISVRGHFFTGQIGTWTFRYVYNVI